MRRPLAPAAVTALLRARLIGQVGGPWTAETERTHVVTQQPDHVLATDETGPLVNVFLYSATPTAALLNAADSGRVPFTLTYLIAIHGVLPLDADILLGQVITALTTDPVVTPQTMLAVLAPTADDPSGLLSKVFRKEAVALADDGITLRLALRPLSLDELSRVWSSFRTPYRPSVLLDVTGLHI